ncbi:hypothetical protein PR202_ga04212 [Eleusine coracana subsp. coracana]|uniref:Alpha/beta-Hydrolases superfamily protein n=1 Tax=Eleusine coracana subsp. coracana TaxID=191504 RepID=A0AAV5BRQ1_ELECO|nr:hypothetical protein PR202_ga04212 [Eleusine coracana subsp. coracana]
MAAASSSEPAAKEKPIVVRVKRKPSQTRPDAFWLEINERPVKKAMLDFSSLSISEPSSSSSSTAKESRSTYYLTYTKLFCLFLHLQNIYILAMPLSAFSVKKLLLQHIETVHHSEAVEDVLQSLLLADSNTREVKSKTKGWNDRIKQDRKHDQLRSAARRQHETFEFSFTQFVQVEPVYYYIAIENQDLGRNARFAQIWRSRKGERNEADESLREICHLYDAVQVDTDGEKRPSEPETITFEEGAVLCNFLPLIREYLPSAAEEIESDIISLAPSEDSEVYDIYTVKEVDDTNMEDASATSYPRLQVDDEEDECYDDDYPYDTDDSNAEDNPLFDYPEEPSEDEGDDPFGDEEGSDPEYEKEEVYDLADRVEDSQLFPSVPALNQAASYLAQTASFLTQCLPVPTYVGLTEEDQELVTLPPPSASGSSSLQTSSIEFTGASLSLGEAGSSGSSQENAGLMVPSSVFQNGTSLFQGLVERARKTVRGSADDIGWLQKDRNLPETEDGTARFLEILDSVRLTQLSMDINKKRAQKLPDSMGFICWFQSSVSKNAREIKEYIEEIYWGARKRVLLLGHSKGGVDAAAALSLYWPQLKDKVAGFRRFDLREEERFPATASVTPGGSNCIIPHRGKHHSQCAYGSLSHVAHFELPVAADGKSTRIPVVVPLSAAMAACSQLLVARYGEKSDGLVTRKDAEVPGSVAVRPERGS